MAENLAGRKFGRLTVLKRVENNKHNHVVWSCVCDCGTEVMVQSGHLKSGHSKSCGCYNLDVLKETKVSHGKSGSRLYAVWAGMKRRCENQNAKEYCRYGGRGIKLCEEWREYAAFDKWAISNGYNAEAPRGAFTIERIDNNGNYEPSNCKLTTNREQSRNKRTNHIVDFNGEKMCVADAADISGLPYYLVLERINRLGWSDYNALHTPRL